MKVILVVTDAHRRNLVFVSDDLQALPLEEAIDATRRGNIDGACVVQRKNGAYLRTKPSVPKNEELETLSITGRNLVFNIQGTHAISTPALSRYLELYRASLAEGEPLTVPIESVGVPSIVVKQGLQKHSDIIFSAARDFDIDPYLIGAIIIDEIARLEPFEEMINGLAGNIVGLNVSIGVAQVKLETANDLIKIGLYNPNPSDSQLPYGRLSNLGRAHLYDYLIQPKHNIRFAAARIRQTIDFWTSHTNTNLEDKPEILATLYSKGLGSPKPNPEPSDRGRQIMEEFYPLARKWLTP